jgi:multidrug resistance protein MdtO
LAASICYVIYNAIDWPGISTAVTTCLLTALSTIGSSHQKQILRILGAMFGGFVLGMGSQIFILPHLDSIGGFALLFVAVTAFSAWFMTSSPRLSYFGIQIAVAFYLINVSEFKMQTSLEVARDRVVGILLGLFAMWLVFDKLWGVPAARELKDTFISNLRLLAQFAREPVSKDLKAATVRRSLGETINTNLDKARARRRCFPRVRAFRAGSRIAKPDPSSAALKCESFHHANRRGNIEHNCLVLSCREAIGAEQRRVR